MSFRLLASGLSRRRGLIAAAVSTLVSLLSLAACGQLAQKERELTFRIEPGTASWYSGLPDGVIESAIPVTSNGHTVDLHAWWWPATQKNAPALLYLHGARWNLTGHLFRIEQLREFGFAVLAIDYRGFGKSHGGLPSEETVYEDAQAAWRRLAELQPDPAKRYIYGHSLGGAVAIDLATRVHGNQAAGLIVESSFTTLADIARSYSYRWLPVHLLLSQKFDSVDKIARVEMPVLIVHGSDDRYVAPRFSEALYDAAPPGKKRLLMVEGGTHNNAMRIGRKAYREALRDLFGWKGKRPE